MGVYLRAKSGGIVAAVACAIFSMTASTKAAVYVAGSSNAFGTLNLNTGAFTSIGTFSLPTGVEMYGMGFGANGMLYGLDSATPADLYQINTSTAALTNLGTIGQSAIDATADAAGALYGLSQGTNSIFYKLNPPSLTATVVGSTGIESGGLAAVTANGLNLYSSVITTTSSTYDLASINVTTGVATDLGNTGFIPANGLIVQGVLYGFDTSVDAIITLNTSNGAGTKISTYSLPGGQFVYASATPASTILPEPGSMGLIAAAGVALLRRRKTAM